MLLPTDPRKPLIEEVASLIHCDNRLEAGRAIAGFSGFTKDKVKDENSAIEMVGSLVHWCLNNNAYEEAAQILWPKTMFDPRPRCTRMIWNAFEKHPFLFLQGSASMSKSYSMGVRILLEWIRNPEYTTVKVVGPSEDHLEAHLFSHLVDLHRQASIPLPGKVSHLFIGLSLRQRRSSIAGVVIPIGQKAAGKLQGAKRFPRREGPSPTFGPMSRLILFLDELANIQSGVWKDLENMMSNYDGKGGFSIVGAYNPVDANSRAGVRAEPKEGWKSLDMETTEEWDSKHGWHVLRLDAMKTENVVQGIDVYPGLQTKKGLAQLAIASGGTTSPGWYTMGRGMFPPDGVAHSVIPNGMLAEIKAEYIFIEKPKACAAADLALEGGDIAVMATGQWGMASGVKFPPSIRFPQGRIEYFKDKSNVLQPRPVIQVEQLFPLPKGDTTMMGKQIINLCRTLSVDPGWLTVDRTGHGTGVHDYLRTEWSSEVIGLNYSEAATRTKIFIEDLEDCYESYERVVSELWFAMRKYIEFNFIKISPVVDTEGLLGQLSGRLFKPGRRNKVESKTEYSARGNKSPDHADAISLLIHGVRKASGVVLSMSTKSDFSGFGMRDEEEGYCRVDVTNRLADHI